VTSSVRSGLCDTDPGPSAAMMLTSRDVGNTLKRNLPVKFFSVAGMPVSKAGSSDVKRVKTLFEGGGGRQ
jgi:hypothetical protein